MAEINIIAFPYATVNGKIEVPSSIKGRNEIMNYIIEHWDKVEFGEPSLDYAGTDFDIED